MFAKDLNQGVRQARTKSVRIKRAYKKILRGFTDRRIGEGRMAENVLVPRGIKLSSPTSAAWRNAKTNTAANLATF